MAAVDAEDAMVQWHGEETDLLRLGFALNNNCGCVFNFAVLQKRCEAHRAAIEDQRFLDGLVFVLSQRDRLINEENSA